MQNKQKHYIEDYVQTKIQVIICNYLKPKYDYLHKQKQFIMLTVNNRFLAVAIIARFYKKHYHNIQYI